MYKRQVYRRPAGVAAGLDLEMPSSGGVTDREIVRAVRAGRLDEAALDALCARVLLSLIHIFTVPYRGGGPGDIASVSKIGFKTV